MTQRHPDPSTAGGEPRDRYAFGESSNQRKAFAGRTVENDLAFLRPHLKPGITVADCGCGGGGLAVQLAQLVVPGEVFAFDQSPGAVEQANALVSSSGSTNVRVSNASVYDSGLEKGSFDVVLFCGVLAHLTEPQRALAHAFALLKAGGLLAAREPQKEGDWFGGKNAGALDEINRMYIADFQELGADPFLGSKLKGLLQLVGFQRVELVPSFSPALSRVEVIGPTFANRVTEASFVEKTLRRGTHTKKDLDGLAQLVAQWRSDPGAVIAISECTALGWKPN